MNKKLDEVEFTIFDTETTGLNPQAGDRIVEIAAVRFKGKDKIAEYQTLVNPHRRISEAAFEVNHITQDMLNSAPDTVVVMPGFLNFIKGSCLCSYNAGFDVEFLNNELRLLGQPVLGNILIADILKMAKRLMPGLERYALWFVADKLGIKSQQEHRALSDVELTWEVFDRLGEILERKKILDFNGFISLFGLSCARLHDINNRKIAQIQEAIDLGVKLKIKYLAGSSAEVSEREVIPKTIRQENNRAYLVGYCCLRNEERTFRIDAILELEILKSGNNDSKMPEF